VYPALAVLQALKRIVKDLDPDQQLEVLWVGGSQGMEVEIVELAGVTFEGVDSAGVHGVGLRALPGNITQLSRGYQQSKHILSRYQPEVMLFTGGYVAVPMALAGRRYRSLLYVPDIEPGLALKTIARFADRIALTAVDSVKFFADPTKAIVTGYPTRPDLSEWKRETAIEVFGLSADLPTLLVFGGSKGARSINMALLPVLESLLKTMQIIHISGQLDWQVVQSKMDQIPQDLKPRYRAYPYLHDQMGAALAGADLALSRAGASTLGEFPAFGLPAILVPYPHAWRYQYVNASYLAEKGAAVVIVDQQLPDLLQPTVSELMKDRAKLKEMNQAMRALAKPEAAAHIAQILLDMAGGSQQERM